MKLAVVTSGACCLAYAAGAAAGQLTPLLGVAVAVAVGAAAFLGGARGAISAGDATVLSQALPRRLARGARVVALLAR